MCSNKLNLSFWNL